MFLFLSWCSIGNGASDFLPVWVLVPFRIVHLDNHRFLLHSWPGRRDDCTALAPCRFAVRFARGERICTWTFDGWQCCGCICGWSCWPGCGAIPVWEVHWTFLGYPRILLHQTSEYDRLGKKYSLLIAFKVGVMGSWFKVTSKKKNGKPLANRVILSLDSYRVGSCDHFNAWRNRKPNNLSWSLRRMLLFARRESKEIGTALQWCLWVSVWQGLHSTSELLHALTRFLRLLHGGLQRLYTLTSSHDGLLTQG